MDTFTAYTNSHPFITSAIKAGNALICEGVNGAIAVFFPSSDELLVMANGLARRYSNAGQEANHVGRRIASPCADVFQWCERFCGLAEA